MLTDWWRSLTWTEILTIENTISTNGRYNQAETALIVDLKTHINQLQSYNNKSLTSYNTMLQ